MAGEWKSITLGEFIRLQRGHDLTEADRRPGNVPVVGSAGITGYHDTALSTGPGLTIGRSGVGSMGVVTYIPSDYWPHNTVLYATDFLGNHPRFACYFLQHLDLRRFNSGSAQASLNRNYIYPISIRVPEATEQQAIACILGALDDKIELNRRRNRTLEAMARAIFQSWFVDFDPVRAKAAGLSADLAALFPGSFEDSALGPIPKGWEVTSLADQITATKGLSYKGEFLCESGEGLPMHNLNSVYEGGGYKNEGLKWYKGEYRPVHLLKPGDVIVTNTEQGFDYLLIGYAAIVPERYGAQGLFSHHIYRIQPKPTSYLPAWFTYLLLRTSRFHEVVAGHSNGTTVNMLPLDGLQKPRFALPPEELVKRFGKLFLPTQRQADSIHDENVTLAALRDALLPKLISGELRVPDAERIVGRVI
jgi:type I restriction enzyme S subunit